MSLPAIPWPGGKRIVHVRQLQTGSPTASTDCGPASLTMSLQAASGDTLRIPRTLHADWIGVLRQQMTPHPSFWPATSLPLHEKAADSDVMLGAMLGVGRFRAAAMDITLPWGDVVDYLRDGYALNVGVDYGAVNDLMPKLSGSRTFRGGHFVSMHGAVRQGGEWWTRLGDPLHDGRQSYPRGWQTVRVERYLRAAETFGGAGQRRAKVLLVRPAKERT